MWGQKRRPLYLTRTEQHRFVRTVYKLWGLLVLDPVRKQERIKMLKLKDLILIYDLLQYGGYLASIIIQEKKNILSGADYEVVAHHIRLTLDPKLKELHGDRADVGMIRNSKGDGFLGHTTMWDDYQSDFKDLVLRGGSGDMCPVPEHTLWDNTSDED